MSRSHSFLLFGFLVLILSGCEDTPTWDEMTGAPDKTITPGSKGQNDLPTITSSPRRATPAAEASIIDTVLALQPVQITDQHMQQLTALNEGLERVEELDLEKSQVTLAGLQKLGKLQWLTSLNLSRIPVDDAILAHLQKMPGLEVLRLNHCPIGDEHLAQLAPIGTLRELYLNETGITDKGFEHFRNFTNLEVLDVTSCQLDGDGFEIFDDMGDARSLREIQAHFTQFGKRGAKHIDGWDQLEVLGVARAAIDDNVMTQFRKLDNLRELDISFNSVSDRGIKKIDDLKNVNRLIVSNCPGISNASLEAIKEWKNLRSLEIDQTNCSTAGIQELKKYLPDLDISFNGRKF